MNHYANYKKRNETERKIFQYNDSDLANILINNKDSINELVSLTPSEIDEKIKNFNHGTIANLLLNNLDMDKINTELDKLNKYEIKTVVKDNFPKENPRELQFETISKIYDAIEKGYKFIVLEAVSGFGKSLIATALSKIYSQDKSYIITVNNQLANQYVDDFEKHEHTKLNPRSTFTCKKQGGYCSPYNCMYSNCRYFKYSDFKNDFEQHSACAYLYALKEGLKSKSVICTYDFFIQENFYRSNYFKPRKLLICDEGHNIDDKISQSTSLKITPKQFNEDLKLDMMKEHEYIIQNEDYYYYLLKFRSIYKNRLKNKREGSKPYVKLKKQLDNLTKFMSYFNKNNENIAFKTDNKDNWIFKPVKTNKIIKDSLLQFGEVCIFMSSSIFDHENFAFDLGIDENEIYSLRVPNIFDLSKNTIKISSEFDMSGEPTETGAAMDSIDTIKEILKTHKNEKGIIHTSNYVQAQYLMDNINDSRLITHDLYDREDVLYFFKNTKRPYVLMSPSMNEGVDLPGDLCRFQIIFKLPYLPFEDPWINKRKNLYEDGKEWYDYKMLTELIQSYGRGIRFEGDYCKTYILDNRLFEVINKDLDGNEIIPKYFINAIENLNQDG